MSRTRYLALCAFVLVGAFAGGYAANRATPVAHAQVLGPGDIRATGITLVNQQGRIQATLRCGASGAELVLDDANGKSRVEIGASGGIIVRDANGRIAWASPRALGILPASE
jgi:hypothetical protein